MLTDGSRPSLPSDTENAAMHRPGGPQGALVKERNVYSVSVGEIAYIRGFMMLLGAVGNRSED